MPKKSTTTDLSQVSNTNPHPVAIVGIGAAFPGSQNLISFWHSILDKQDQMQEVPPTHWLIEDYYDPDPKAPCKIYAKRGAFLPPIPFDPMEFGIPPQQIPVTDTAQLLPLVIAKQLLYDALCTRFNKVAEARTSVILGMGSATELVGQMASKIQRPIWVNALRESGIPESKVQEAADRIFNSFPEWNEATFPGLLCNVVAGRMANRLDFGGTNCTVDAACASSLASIVMGVRELQLGDSDLVISGGADTINDPIMYMCFSKTPALSPTGDIRPFSDNADGTMLGEGIGLVALRRLADAERDGDTVYAVIRGIGTSSDGRAKSVYAPRPEGQTVALQRAYERAGYSPREVELVEAHGTGTLAGDAAEVAGLKGAFPKSETGEPWCALGSIKSQIGHTKSAAGVAGMIKIACALHHKVLPPTIKVNKPNPKLGIEGSPFYLNTETRPWIRAEGQTRKAGVSSFGFGGSNYHLTLEEYQSSSGCQSPAHRFNTWDTQIIPLSADTREALVQTLKAATSVPEERPFLRHVRECQLSFKRSAPFRLVLLAESVQTLVELAGKVLAKLNSTHQETAWEIAKQAWFATGNPSGKLAFIFPGQGSQYPGMGTGIACHFEAARKIWDRAAALDPAQCPPLHKHVFPIPAFDDATRTAQAEALKATEIAQPAIGLSSLSYLEVLRSLGLSPDLVLGHSYGELTALFAAGVIDRSEALIALSRKRGLAMADAARQTSGGMIAVIAPHGFIQTLLKKYPSLTAANWNSPRQTVLAGTLETLDQAEAYCRDASVTAKRLPVSTAFHSPIVAEALPDWKKCLESYNFSAPQIPVIGTTQGELYPNQSKAIRTRLAQQLAEPVHFQKQIEHAYAEGARTFVEVGPGQVLTTLTKDILESKEVRILACDARPGGLSPFIRTLAELTAIGLPVNFSTLWDEWAEPMPDAPKKSAATIFLSGANYGKPYPPSQGAAGRAQPVAEPIPAISSNLAAKVQQQSTTPTPSHSISPPIMQQHSTLSSQSFPTHAQGHGAPSGDLLHALQTLQNTALAAHEHFQKTLTESHLAFLRTTEVALQQLGGQAVFTNQLQSSSHTPAVVVPQLTPAPVAPVDFAPPQAATSAPPPLNAQANSPSQTTTAAPASPAPVLTPTEPATKESPQTLLYNIVAEATGYPVEMLENSMEIEAGLGIDSIKRVEIFSALSAKIEAIAVLDSSQLGEIRTLGDILALVPDEGTPVNGAASASPEPLDRLVPHMVGKEAPGFKMQGLQVAAPAILTTPDTLKYAQALAQALGKQGIHALTVAQIPESCTTLILLEGLHTPHSFAEAEQLLEQGFQKLRAFCGQPTAQSIVWVQSTDGAFGLNCANLSPYESWKSGMPGLLKCIAKEHPSLQIKVIDTRSDWQSTQAFADAVATELCCGGDDCEVAITPAASRHVRQIQSIPFQTKSKAPKLPENSVWIVSGGARGVTAACLKALVSRLGSARFALFGRTPTIEEPQWARDCIDEKSLRATAFKALQRKEQTPPEPKLIQQTVSQILAAREVREQCARLEAAGAEIAYYALDITDAETVAHAVDQVRARWGQINGLIHAAGVLADKRLVEKTDDAFRRVVHTKVRGLYNLLTSTQSDALSVISAFSSVAATAGNLGQSDYALANSVLDQVLLEEAKRRGDTCRVKSLAWGPWDGGMVDASLARHFETLGMGLIPLDVGAAHCVEELLGTDSTPHVVIGKGLAKWLKP